MDKWSTSSGYFTLNFDGIVNMRDSKWMLRPLRENELLANEESLFSWGSCYSPFKDLFNDEPNNEFNAIEWEESDETCMTPSDLTAQAMTDLSCKYCMWTGICTNKKHLRPEILPDGTVSNVPAGGSLLIPRNTANTITDPSTSWLLDTANSQKELSYDTNLDSGGSSPRPETPEQSSNEESVTGEVEEEEKEAEGPIFRHDVHEKLSEYISAAVKAAPAIEVTNQRIARRSHGRRRDEEDEQQTQTKWNTLIDHSYHLNQPQNLEHLGIQTPSESEEDEDIDVVSYENGVLQSMSINSAQQHQYHLQQQFQLSMNTANKTVARRPRGRPPGRPPGKTVKLPTNPSRKRVAQPGPSNQQPPVKRARRRKASNASMSPKSDIYEEHEIAEMDEAEKRNLHNNMERQRRISLRNLFEQLRQLVPETMHKDKSPKVNILKEATIYCNTLTRASVSLSGEAKELKRQQEKLRAKLRLLRRNFALTR